MRVRNVLVILVLILIVGALGIKFVGNVRNLANRTQCLNNLKQIGLALRNYHDTYRYFPSATVPNTTLPPDKRLSWITQIFPTFMVGGVKSLLDNTKPWDDETNCPPPLRVRIDTMSGATREERMTWKPKPFSCPANRTATDASFSSPTHYTGIAGLGEDAAQLSLSDPRAGFFGYDRKLSLQDIKGGTERTMAVTEVLDGGPWTAGGWATVRGLVAGEQPYMGNGGQFATKHWAGGPIAVSRPVTINVLFADGSVRPITGSVSPEIFEALATVAGGEQVDNLP